MNEEMWRTFAWQDELMQVNLAREGDLALPLWHFTATLPLVHKSLLNLAPNDQRRCM